MEAQYGYANARLRAMKSRLLTRSDYARLLDEQTLDDVIARLTHTAYRPNIEAALIKARGWECLSEALRQHLAQTLGHISGFFDSMPLLLWNILIERWQVFSLKTILRGQAHHVRGSEILDVLIPAGDLREADLRRLAQQTSLRATVDLLATWHHPYARPLLEAMPRYAEGGDLAAMELALDRAHYAAALDKLGGLEDTNADLVRQVIRNEIDATNILIMIRLSEGGRIGAHLTQRYGSPVQETLLLKGGGVATERLLRHKELVTLDELVRELADTNFGDVLRRGQTLYSERRTLSAFEDEIDAKLAQQKLALFLRDPLSIGIPIAYLTAFVNEIRNLRVIGRGKVAGWKREEIEMELRLWQN